MRPSTKMLQHSLRLTLFTHDTCSLCVDAQAVMSKVWDRRRFEYTEVNIKAPDQTKWRHLYEFDIPVVHIDRTATLASTHGQTTAAAAKLKHRFNEAELEKAMDEVEKA
ncbi:glutaredoxin domain containing protein [Zymoseptoria brevis]|uniref:Glutaredoxin-like protein n=1 Tax=Zymoseptoria brevis TaxID=1047168 RepID=A0A0F4GV16_9PEZI|nr:glutaredoxin domain containing protein [Zymoseptoria brevis]